MDPVAAVQPSSINPSATRSSAVAPAILWAALVAGMVSIAQGLVALRFEVGLLYPLMGYAVGSILQKKAAHVSAPVRQRTAVVFTYLAIALSPLIPFGNAVGFEPVRMRNTAVGLVLVFVPQMLKTGVIGLVNTVLLVLALRQAWGQARAVLAEQGLPDRAPAEMQADQ